MDELKRIEAKQYKGVSYTSGKFHATIWLRGKKEYLGSNNLAKTAATFYDRALQYRSGKASTGYNFPDRDRTFDEIPHMPAALLEMDWDIQPDAHIPSSMQT